jgi:hypothetical protein
MGADRTGEKILFWLTGGLMITFVVWQQPSAGLD